MPTVIIKAFSAKKLPSPILVATWVQNWTAAAGGVWNAPTYNDDECTVTVNGIAVAAATTPVQGTVDNYNETHPGNDMITVSVH
ncbi:hypothetical protein AWB74_07080 [Caballeronia arvi]|uniref:Uncharacterized protein n=1 Tax=Caballeronia arvi TaxID=1777135 RepID=A0A158KV68_9BURK|nr:hypothetical protein [Caballeronia arvi]SAL84845.1 hypothetical protein AWB74_07080 [Caballeronia arvi]